MVDDSRLEMLFREGASGMALQIGFECAGLIFVVECDSRLDFPGAERCRGGDGTPVVAGKAFIQIRSEASVVMGLGCHIGENIDVIKRHCGYVIYRGKGYSGGTWGRGWVGGKLVRLRFGREAASTTPWHLFKRRGRARLAAPSAFEKVVARTRIELVTQGFSVLCSTN